MYTHTLCACVYEQTSNPVPLASKQTRQNSSFLTKVFHDELPKWKKFIKLFGSYFLVNFFLVFLLLNSISVFSSPLHFFFHWWVVDIGEGEDLLNHCPLSCLITFSDSYRLIVPNPARTVNFPSHCCTVCNIRNFKSITIRKVQTVSHVKKLSR